VTHYAAELQRLDETYSLALNADIRAVKTAIAGTSQSSLIGVGSGGSFTVASLLCGLHETYTGRVSRPSTCLELICNPSLASSSPVFLISAEGKNPDIVEALKRARHHSSRPLHVLTNHPLSPLMTSVESFGDIGKHVFPLPAKDGYLATNSLLLNATIIARAYNELDRSTSQLPAALADCRIDNLPVDDWIDRNNAFAKAAASRPGVIVLFSPMLRALAIDLESKLSEAALLFCQLSDLRSFAHGRHLWLAERADDCSVIAFVEPSLAPLWTHTKALFPDDVPSLTVPLDGHRPSDLIAGLVATMHLVSALATNLGRDAARPTVPAFGRAIYYMDLASVIPEPSDEHDAGDGAKAEVLGARWPSRIRRTTLRRALQDFVDALSHQRFRAVVFDYDGTLCQSARRDEPPTNEIVQALEHLIDSGIVVGIATGRGKSVDEHLRSMIPDHKWKSVLLALYNGGLIMNLGEDKSASPSTSEFLSHVTRIARRLKDLGVPIDEIRTTHPYQVSIRFHDGIPTDSMWFVLADALRQAGLDVSRLECSKHSVDVLAPQVNKSSLIAHLAASYKIDPYQVLTVGDQGAWPGNDASLLEHRFSLSVDVPSRRLDRGWKLAPAHKRHVDATLWYLAHITADVDGSFTFTASRPDAPQ